MTICRYAETVDRLGYLNYVMQTDFLQPLALTLLLIAERNKRVREAESKLVGILALFGYFFLVLAIFMTVLALWSAVKLYAVWATWPRAAA